MKKVGDLNGIPVMSSPFVQDGYMYLISKQDLDAWVIKGVKLPSRWERLKLWLRRKLGDKYA